MGYSRVEVVEAHLRPVCMTQDEWNQIEDLQTLDNIYEEEIARLNAEAKSLKQKRQQIERDIKVICDCTKPDGTTTWESHYLYGQCTVCGRNDL